MLQVILNHFNTSIFRQIKFLTILMLRKIFQGLECFFFFFFLTLQVSVSPTECFLRHLTYPENEECAVDLRQSAVVIMSQLDRLASSYLPISASHKVDLLLHFILPFA